MGNTGAEGYVCSRPEAVQEAFSSVNIIMATHNGEHHLGEQLQSIRSQSHEKWRLYISDDHSTDGTVGLIQEASASDSRITVLPGPKAGGSAQSNFMSAIQAVPTGPLMLSDQDDVWFTDKIELSLREARLHGDISEKGVPFLIHTDAQVTDAGLNPMHASYKRYSALLNESSTLGHALVENVVTGNTCLLSPKLVELAKMTDATTPMIMHDWWIYLVAACFGDVFYLDVPTLFYRQHGANAVGALAGANFPDPNRVRQAMRRAAESVAQSRSFLRVYGPIMPSEQRERVASYAHISSVPRWRRNGVLHRHAIEKSRFNAAMVHKGAIAMLRNQDVQKALSV